MRARKVFQIPVIRWRAEGGGETMPSSTRVLPSPFLRNDRRNPEVGRDVPDVREMRLPPPQKGELLRVGYDWMGGDTFRYATRLRALSQVAPGVCFAALVPVQRPQLLWSGHAVERGEYSPDYTLCGWSERSPKPEDVTFGLPTCPACLKFGFVWMFFEVQPYPDWRVAERVAHQAAAKKRRKARSRTRFDRDVFEWKPKVRGPTVPLPHDRDAEDLVSTGREDKLRSRRESARRRKDTP